MYIYQNIYDSVNIIIVEKIIIIIVQLFSFSFFTRTLSTLVYNNNFIKHGYSKHSKIKNKLKNNPILRMYGTRLNTNLGKLTCILYVSCLITFWGHKLRTPSNGRNLLFLTKNRKKKRDHAYFFLIRLKMPENKELIKNNPILSGTKK